MAKVPDDAGWILDEFDAPRFWEHVNLRGGFAFLRDPLSHLTEASGECWLWTGWNAEGYGRFRVFGGQHQAHRIAYRDFGNKIAEGEEIDHLCRNTSCVRPSHLEPVAPVENVARSRTPLTNRDECRHGHALTPENIGQRRHGARIIRFCKTCRAESRGQNTQIAAKSTP